MMSRLLLLVPAAYVASSSMVVSAAENQPHESLETVIVTGTPLSTNPLETAQPVSVLAGEDLQRNVSASLGETVSGQPGVTSTYYGPVASRPVIRGLSGYRVQMLDDGLGSMDASSLSDDHAVMLEPSLAHRIEVLRGPAALLYGSGGAGGAVNVVGARLPDSLPQDPFSATMEMRGDSALDERTGVGQVNGKIGGLLLHLDGYRRETDDVRIPGAQVSDRLRAQLEAAGAALPDGDGRVPNSASESWGSSAGATYFGTTGSIGLGYNHADSQYDLPAEEEAFIKMKQDRFDLKGQLQLADGPFKTLKLRAGYNDYTHTEFEAPGVPGTLFNNKAYEVRATADHVLSDGWRGTVGMQNSRQDFEAIGEEAFVPPSITKTLGVFAFEERDFGAWTLQGGARLDRQQINVNDLPDYDANAVNVALGALWHWSANDTLSLNVTRTERHPQATELYADGVHGALGRIELGSVDLDKEKGYTVDLGLRHSDERIAWNLGTYFNRYDNYIFVAPTGTVDAAEGLPVFAYRQEGVNLYGFEGELDVPVRAVRTGDLMLRFMGDYLRGEVRNGGDLPSMPPYRLGAGIDYDLDALHLGLEVMRYAKQDRVANDELPTDGYTLVSLDASYRWPLAQGNVFAFLHGDNLLDEEARQHTSALKDIVPLPGRGVRAGVRVEF